MPEPTASAPADHQNRVDSYGSAHSRALRAVAVQFFVNGALFASVLPRMPEIRDKIGVTAGGIGWILSAAGASGLAGSVIAGPAMQRFGSRWVMVCASGVVCVSLAVVGVAATPAIVLVGLVGMVSFDVLVDIAMNLQGSTISARRHSPVINRLHGLWSLGAAVGGVVASQMAEAGVSLTVHLVGSGAVMFGVLGYVGRGLLRQDELLARSTGLATNPAKPGSQTKRRSRGLGINSTLIMLAAAGFFAITVEGVPIDWAAFRLRDDVGASVGLAALGYTAVTAGMTISRFAGDWVLVRVGQARFDQVSTGLAAAGLATAALVPNQYWVMAGFMVAGVGTAALMPSMYDRAAHYTGRPGAGLGALTAGMRTASIIVPTLVGTLATYRLGVGFAMAVVALPCVVGYLLAASAVHRTKGRALG